MRRLEELAGPPDQLIGDQCAGQRMRGLELDSALAIERLPTKETGPVTDLRRCATG
jgi:hypothetical protein